MNFDESVEYLYSLGNEVEAMKLGLENIRTLLTALGEPQKEYLKVQVAGTNGKGSVCVFLDSICVGAGIRTGLYTSPHLVSITERIKIAGQDIGESDFGRLATHVRETAEDLLAKGQLEYRPTFFEQVTAIALVAFAEAKIELAILETGLGGRLDATTAANAEIAAITRIDVDHQEYLGETLAEIAGEKAAIVHAGSNVVVGEQKDEVMRVIAAACANFGVSPKLAQQVKAVIRGRNKSGSECVGLSEPGVITTRLLDFRPQETPTQPSGFPPSLPLTFNTDQACYEKVYLGLLGEHQIENAKLAILLAETLQQHFEIPPEEIVGGLSNARHPGRLEFVGNFLFDGAHNKSGAAGLKAFLDNFVDKPITMIFASMRDKDVVAIANLLFPRVETLILTRSDNARSMTAEELVGFVPSEFDPSCVYLTNSVDEALDMARTMAIDGLILVTGSLYLVGEVQRLLKSKSQI